MLTKSEYSTSTSSLSTVFSGSLTELESILKNKDHKLSGDQSQESCTFRQRLKDRINKNKDHLFKVQQVIEESKREILELQDLKKLLFQGEVAPLSTFVDQVSNTTNSALLSMQRELAKRECDYEYVVYDRNVICLDHKFKSEENSYLKHHSQAAKMFKQNKYDKEEKKYKQGCKDTERLLQNLDGLNKSCKHQIKQKNQKIREIKQRIKQKEEALFNKQQEYSRLTRMATQKQATPKLKLNNVKEELRVLRNEKLTLEECEQDCKSEVKKLTKSLKNLKNRNQVEEKKVKALKEEVGKISESYKNELKKHTVVEDSVVKLKTYLRKEKETKDKFLIEVNHQKKKFSNNRYMNTDVKTLNAVDWNKIENEDSSCLSGTKYSWADEKSCEESKVKNSVNDTESQVEVSFISFDPDCESTQSDGKLPFGVLSDVSKSPSKAHSRQGSNTYKPTVSSHSKRSLGELRRLDSEITGDTFGCSKIPEETDEESVANLTPRLPSEEDQETENLKGIKNSVCMRKSAEQDFNKDIYASKTTLETEGSSQNQYELESTSTYNERDGKDNVLNLSNISSEGISNDERFYSPINAGRGSVPALNFSKIQKAMASLNSSCMSTTNGSVVDSKYGKRLSETPSLDSTLNSITNSVYQGSGFKPAHYKNRLSHGKLTINNLTKGHKKSAGGYLKASGKHDRKHSEDYEVSWKAKKDKISGDGFKKNHWKFTKKSKGKDVLADN